MPPDSEKRDEREYWNRKYRESPDHWLEPDPFLERAFSEYVLPAFPNGGSALDLAGGAGRHSIWLAKHGWDVTLVDISDTAIEQARQNAGPLAPHIHSSVNDLTHFRASQSAFDLMVVFFFLERSIFHEILASIKPGGFLIYKTHTQEQARLSNGPKNEAHMLGTGELPQLVAELRVLHYREIVGKKATAELVARKDTPLP